MEGPTDDDPKTMNCDRCGSDGHSSIDCSRPETAIMDFLSSARRGGTSEWQPSSEVVLGLADLGEPRRAPDSSEP
jgi:hypothetical protein